MATEAYDVVASLRELLQSKERTEQNRVQTALQAMQFAQSKKMQDQQMAAQQIQFLQTVNAQQKQKAASDFIQDTGLGALYSPTEDEEERTKSVEKAQEILTKDTRKGGYGFSEMDASRIITGLWAHKAGSHDEILSIASDLNNKLTLPSEDLSSSDKKFLSSFVEIGYITPTEYEYGYQESGQLKSIASIMQSEQDIIDEMYEFGRGDFQIQREIGKVEAEEVDWESVISGFQDDRTARIMNTDIDAETKELKNLSKSIKDKQLLIDRYQLELNSLQELKNSDLITSNQSSRLNELPSKIETQEEELLNLSSKIDTRKKDLSVTTAIAAKNALLETGFETTENWANQINIAELSQMLSKYNPRVLENLVEGNPFTLMKDAFVYKGNLEGAPISDTFKLVSLAKRIDEAKTLKKIKDELPPYE